MKDLRGNKVVLYFYPKDDTPECTREACSFRDSNDELLSSGIKVLGVSADSVQSHRDFVGKFNLPFPLLSDEDKKVIEEYESGGSGKSWPDRDGHKADDLPQIIGFWLILEP